MMRLRRANTLFALLLAGLLAAFAAADEPPVDERVADLEEREPSVAETREAAVRHAGLDPGRARAWSRRSRLAGLLPGLTLRIRRGLARDQGLKIDAGASEYLRIDTGDDLVVEARATWNLGRLVFDPAELRAAREGARLAAERLDLETEATRLYYERRRAQVEWILDPPDDPADAARRRLEIDELTAALDAMTGGWFTEETE